MNIEPIHGYHLDLKQDFPEDLRLAQEECKSLEHTNMVLTVALVIVGVGLSIAFIHSQISESKAKQKSH
jgi:hypothetical protein